MKHGEPPVFLHHAEGDGDVDGWVHDGAGPPIATAPLRSALIPRMLLLPLMQLPSRTTLPDSALLIWIARCSTGPLCFRPCQ